MNPGSSLNNASLGGLAFTVNSIGSGSTATTLNGQGYNNGSASDINYLVIGNGNVNWSFPVTLNVINTNMFQNFGGTINFGTNVTQDLRGQRQSASEFAVCDDEFWNFHGGMEHSRDQ